MLKATQFKAIFERSEEACEEGFRIYFTQTCVERFQARQFSDVNGLRKEFTMHVGSQKDN